MALALRRSECSEQPTRALVRYDAGTHRSRRRSLHVLYYQRTLDSIVISTPRTHTHTANGALDRRRLACASTRSRFERMIKRETGETAAKRHGGSSARAGISLSAAG